MIVADSKPSGLLLSKILYEKYEIAETAEDILSEVTRLVFRVKIYRLTGCFVSIGTEEFKTYYEFVYERSAKTDYLLREKSLEKSKWAIRRRIKNDLDTFDEKKIFLFFSRIFN